MARLHCLSTRREVLDELERWRVHAARGTGKARLSLQDIAKASGIPKSTLATYLTGATAMPADALDAVVVALGAGPAETRAWAAAWERAVDGGSAAGVRLLPGDVSAFTGRREYLKELDRLLEGDGTAVVISALAGMGGVGKTALAVHWAHRVAARFPDGQLYVNLRGYGPDEPMRPEAAVELFLRALGVELVPTDLDQRVTRYRAALAGRRMLVILDNARSADQVRPLLPGSPDCRTVVTSRDSLAGLVARDGAHRLTLDRLTTAEALDLLARLLGIEAVHTEPAASTELAQLCAGLPLALRVAAERAAGRTPGALADLVAELRDQTGRLDVLDAEGDPLTDLRAVLSWSYRALSPDAGRLFGLLGLAPGPDLDRAAIGSLAGDEDRATRRALRELVAAHLVEQHRPGRYRLHDLVRLYAAEQAERPAAAQALRRLVDFFLHTALAAVRLLDPNREPIAVEPPVPGCRPLRLADKAAANAWFDAEYPGLLAAQRLAAEWRWYDAVWQFAWSLDTLNWRRGRPADICAAWEAGLAAAEQLGDLATLARAHRRLGTAYAHVGRYPEAFDQLHAGLALAERAGNTFDQAHTYLALGRTAELRKHFERAVEYTSRGLELFRRLDNPVRQAMALNAIGCFHSELGRLDEARTYCEDALALYRDHDDPPGTAATEESLGHIAQLAGRYADAVDHLRRAADLLRGLGSIYAEADALDRLGQAHAALDQPDLARAAWDRARDLFRAQHRTADAERVGQELTNLAG